MDTAREAGDTPAERVLRCSLPRSRLVSPEAPEECEGMVRPWGPRWPCEEEEEEEGREENEAERVVTSELEMRVRVKPSSGRDTNTDPLPVGRDRIGLRALRAGLSLYFCQLGGRHATMLIFEPPRKLLAREQGKVRAGARRAAVRGRGERGAAGTTATPYIVVDGAVPVLVPHFDEDLDFLF